jgi:hypothetical protein
LTSITRCYIVNKNSIIFQLAYNYFTISCGGMANCAFMANTRRFGLWLERACFARDGAARFMANAPFGALAIAQNPLINERSMDS